MARQKAQDNTPEPNAFPDGTVLHEWGQPSQVSLKELSASRSRQSQVAPRRQRKKMKGQLDWDNANTPEGLQYCWGRERMMNQDDADNIYRMLSDGWEFVLLSDHPELAIHNLPDHLRRDREDNYIRQGGQILMKKLKEEYQEDQEDYRQEGEETRIQAQALTDYMGSTTMHPKLVVENSGSYTPNWKYKRG